MYVSPKRWHLPASLHGAKSQNNIIILTAVKTSNITLSKLLIMTSLLSQVRLTQNGKKEGAGITAECQNVFRNFINLPTRTRQELMQVPHKYDSEMLTVSM
jgi:hypothetical protein